MAFYPKFADQPEDWWGDHVDRDVLELIVKFGGMLQASG